MALIPKRKTERAPPVDKLIKPAIGIGLALLAYQFFTGLDKEIPRIDPTDELVLREVLFGEGTSSPTSSYAVLCHKETDTHLSSVFQDAQNDGSAPVEFRLLDCDYVLPSSQKSIAERFKLNLKQRPTVFVSGNAVGPPKQIPPKHLKTGNMLVKLLKNMLEPRAQKIETTQDLRTKCLNKDYCGLLLKGSTKASKSIKTAMSNLVSQHPKVSFGAVDTSLLFVKNLEEYLPEYREGVDRFVVFSKVSGSLEAGSDRLVTSIAPLSANQGMGYAPMNALVQSVVDRTAQLQKIPALPVLKTRTKKLEQEERAKRQRKQERTQQETQQETTFAANDGSREGRRLERERRREEHRREHNVKPKTEEELKEMERQRRIRMQEEADKWNIAPEDAPEEGEYVEEESQVYEMKEGEEEDEEVMDLD